MDNVPPSVAAVPGALNWIHGTETETINGEESTTWRELVRVAPDYEAARTNLAILGSQSEVVLDETAAVVPPPPAAGVKTIKDERKLSFSVMRNSSKLETCATKVETE